MKKDRLEQKMIGHAGKEKEIEDIRQHTKTSYTGEKLMKEHGFEFGNVFYIMAQQDKTRSLRSNSRY